MKRRTFISRSAMTTAGGLLLPSFLMSSCGKEDGIELKDYDGKVIVIGAGAAGLFAAQMLKQQEVDVEVLEASAVHGGRMGKLTGFADYPLDTGAQWLHGRRSIVGDLIKDNNVANSLDDTDLTYWFQQQLTSNLPKDPFIFEGSGKPDVSFDAYAMQQGFGTEYNDIVEGIAGDYGAAASRLSVFHLNEEEYEWSSGDEDYKFEGAFFDVIDQFVAADVAQNIRYNTVVNSINYAGERIEITDTDGNSYMADKVIVTLPISLLKQNAISFTPALPKEKTTAFSKIGMDAGMKVFLKFNTTFYEDNILGGSICAAYANERIGKTGNDNVLLAFVMGEQAEYLNSLGSDQAIVSELIAELDQMYNGQASAQLIDSVVQNWTNEPFIQGAYSYSTVGMGNARSIAAQTVDDKLYFAGEAMNLNGHHQTVHGAAETGIEAVTAILTA